MNTSSFTSISTKVTIVHTVTHFVIGLLSFLFFDYSTRYADPAVAVALRSTDHLMSLPELLVQSFLLAYGSHYLVNHPEKRWLNISLTIMFTVIVLLALLGILSALGFLPAPE